MNTKLKHRFLSGGLMLLAALTFPSRTYAEFVFTFSEVGKNVVVAGSGTINLTALTYGGSGPHLNPILQPFFGVLTSGPEAPYSAFTGVSGPLAFGTGQFIPVLRSGDAVGIQGIDGRLYVPFGYVSGTPLSDSLTFADATIGSLGLTPGKQYVYTWGAGDTADSLTVNIPTGTAAVPEPATAILIIYGCGAFLVICWMRRRRFGLERA